MLRALASGLLLLLLAAPAREAAETIVPVSVFGTYLLVDPVDTATGPTVISLAALGITPGTLLQLRAIGDFDNGPGGDEFVIPLAVFSAGTTLLAPTERYRVPGALSTTRVGGSGSTCPSNLLTDIPEDFYIHADSSVVVVPEGATHLFVMPGECYFVDNSDPDLDYAVGLEVLGTVGVGSDAPSFAFAPPSPNPAVSEARFSLRLARALALRLALYSVDGRLVRTLANGTLGAGAHDYAWDLRDSRGERVRPGVYYARLAASDGRLLARRAIVVR